MTTSEESGSRRGPRGPRGDVADRIREAARQSFATDGYAGTTMQGIARAAGVDTKLVRYYFTDKETLFAECLVLPAEFLERVQAASQAPAGERGRALVQTLINAWNTPAVAVVLRTSMLIAGHSPRALQLVTTAFSSSIIPLVEGATSPADRDLRVGLIASQMVGLAFARYIFAIPEATDASDETVIAAVAPAIQRYLEGNLAA